MIEQSRFFVERISDKIDPTLIKVVFDLGANNGRESAHLANLFPNSVVYAFEANPCILPNTYLTANLVPRMRVVPLAVANQSGFTVFHVSEAYDFGASSLFKFNPEDHCVKYSPHSKQEQVIVNCVRLEEWMYLVRMSKVDIIWADIQGAELMAFQGLGDRLKEVKAIYCEMELREYYLKQPLYAEVHAFLEQSGFERVWESPHTANDLDCNVIYINRNL